MAKLYAELSSDKGGRKVSKGGNDKLTITINTGNNEVITLLVQSEKEIVAAMNYGQNTDGITVRKEHNNELIAYRLNS
jgi:hypothetical protein